MFASSKANKYLIQANKYLIPANKYLIPTNKYLISANKTTKGLDQMQEVAYKGSSHRIWIRTWILIRIFGFLFGLQQISNCFRLAFHSRSIAHIRKSIETDNKRFSTSCYVETDIETLLQEICEIFYTIFYGTGTGWRDPFESCFTSV